MDVVKLNNIQHLRCSGHVIQMEEDVSSRQVFDEGISNVNDKVDHAYIAII